MIVKRIVFINTFAWAGAHEMFDASLLLMCSKSAESVICRVNKSHYLAMKHVLRDSKLANVDLKEQLIIGGDKGILLLLRYIGGALLDWINLFKTRKDDLIIMPFNNVFSLRGINLLNKILKRKILVFCHGEMEFVVSNVNRRGILSRMLSFLCRNFFLNLNITFSDGIYFSVFGEKIKQNLAKFLSQDKILKFVTLDHPYIFQQYDSIENNTNLNKSINVLNIGTIGGMNLSKGMDKLLQFAEKCKAINLNVKISHTGKISVGRDKIIKNGSIDLPAVNKELKREEYNARINILDFLLFFYGCDNYKVTASGAIMDAIVLRKPIISLRNDYFEYIFEKFGCFGYLVDSVDQMVHLVDMIGQGKLVDKFDFDMIISSFLPESLQDDFNLIIKVVCPTQKNS